MGPPHVRVVMPSMRGRACGVQQQLLDADNREQHARRRAGDVENDSIFMSSVRASAQAGRGRVEASAGWRMSAHRRRDGVAYHAHDTAIVKAAIALGHALGLKMIAEGVPRLLAGNQRPWR